MKHRICAECGNLLKNGEYYTKMLRHLKELSDGAFDTEYFYIKNLCQTCATKDAEEEGKEK